MNVQADVRQVASLMSNPRGCSMAGRNVSTVFIKTGCLVFAECCRFDEAPHDGTTGQMKTKWVRDLSFNHAGTYHEFSVTDPIFMRPIWNRMTDTPQLMKFPDASNHFLCLSSGVEFHGRHYKICATIFQP